MNSFRMKLDGMEKMLMLHKLQTILEREFKERGYPLSDLFI